MAEKMTLSALNEILAKFRPLREPDSLYMTVAMQAKVKKAAEHLLVAKTAFPTNRYAGMDIYCYPAGTVLVHKKTGQRSVIEEGVVLSAIKSDVEVIEAHPRPVKENEDG